MAVSIMDPSYFRYKSIFLFIDEDSNQLDPWFAAFKRIDRIYDNDGEFCQTIDNLELIYKALFRIDLLAINKNCFDEIRKIYKDKDPNLMIENLELYYDSEKKRPIKDIEFINQISPKKLIIKGDIWTVKNIEVLTLLNCANVDLYFSYRIKSNMNLWFKNSPIQLFDYKSDQMFTFEWESIKISIKKEDEDGFKKKEIEKIKLFKQMLAAFYLFHWI